ncbi:nucleoside diphosphate kinase regulator [Luteimonas lutimaris]|uniref:Nucleoside diphosphate kinase regulator n=1 Tax=Luteimonas lutimaris TaxID=698645 RepID=A0ABP7MGL5_9GAMM|nr:nucleoside diphosphate kinase regulator [Luteimonas sp.]
MATPETARPSIVMSRLDYDRIEALLEGANERGIDTASLEAEMERADVVEPAQMPGDVISMNSTARFVDESSGEERELTLVYPRDATGEPGRVSILAPVGSALLGLRVGQSIDWPMPGNRTLNLRVLSIKYQPEAAGELHR